MSTLPTIRFGLASRSLLLVGLVAASAALVPATANAALVSRTVFVEEFGFRS